MAAITFKAKVRTLTETDGTESPYIEFKRNVTRRDCTLKPHQHPYYNSDLFPGMLQRAYKAVVGNTQWARLSQLPTGVCIDTSKFLAVITITLPESFR